MNNTFFVCCALTPTEKIKIKMKCGKIFFITIQLEES
jgi:hypothetical protein